nr:uncharacterized protein LOC119618264 [Chlorocebus sabaeus]
MPALDLPKTLWALEDRKAPFPSAQSVSPLCPEVYTLGRQELQTLLMPSPDVPYPSNSSSLTHKSSSDSKKPSKKCLKRELYFDERLLCVLLASEESPTHKDRGDGERLVDARVVQVVPLRFDSTPCGDPIQHISDEDTVYDICDEDAVDICNDTVDISNEAAVPNILNDAGDICNEDTAENISNEDIVYNITNEDTEQHISEKEDAAKEPFILENGTYPEITHFLREKRCLWGIET